MIIGGGASGSLARSVVGSGYESGIPYVDLRFQGMSPGGSLIIRQQTDATVAVSTPHAATVFARLVGGSWNNVGALTAGMMWVTPNTGARPNIVVTDAPLNQQRFANSATSPATTTLADVRLTMTTAAGEVDFTVRVGAFQLEQGNAATAPILPPLGSPAVSARAPDFCSVAGSDVPGGLPASAGSLAFRGRVLVPGNTGTPKLWQIDDGSDTNRINVARDNASGQLVASITTGGVTVAQAVGPVLPLDTDATVTTTWDAAGIALSVDRAAPVTAALSGALPPLTTLRPGGDTAGSHGALLISALPMWRHRMAAAEMQSLLV